MMAFKLFMCYRRNWKSKETISVWLEHWKYERSKGSKAGKIGVLPLLQGLLCQAKV